MSLKGIFNYFASQIPGPRRIPLTDNEGKLQTGYINASETPTANMIPVSDSTGKLKNGYLNASQTPGENTIPLGQADASLKYGWVLGWEDLRFSMERVRQGVTERPIYDVNNLGALFENNKAAEKVLIVAQMPHSWKIGTSIYPHIHFIQDRTEVPVFKMDYRWYLNGGTIPDFQTITATTFAFEYTGTPILQIVSFAPITNANITDVSSILDIKIYRDDNNFTGTVLTKEFDIHYQCDSVGSINELSR